MPKCSICDATYDAEYDACPHCAKRRIAPTARTGNSNSGSILLGAVVIAIAIGGAVWFYVASQPPTLAGMLGF